MLFTFVAFFVASFGFLYMDKELLEILACPACRASVTLDGDEIACQGCGRRYPVKDGVPVMLVAESRLESEKSEQAERERH